MANSSVAPAAPTARTNIERVLRHLGLDSAIAITREEKDRVYGWPITDTLMRRVVLEGWQPELKESAEFFHGSEISYREPASPGLQVVFHKPEEPNPPAEYFIELDLDFHPPQIRKPWTFILHGLETGRNWITGKKTDPVAMSAALDKRFGKETQAHA